ncbi:MAG: FKBP-type peptidyl-prolyl cis-trans isomerase [Balneolales bacterium]|nr:FKBP-type peptidyl-prolyl cis-trans isomerase [Balneolales bacterium]
MKLSHFLLTAFASVFILNACTQTPQEYSKDAELNTLVDSASYTIGHQYGARLATQGFPDIGMEEFIAGFITGLDGEDSKVPDTELQALFDRFNVYILDKMKTDNKIEQDEFLASNLNEEGVSETPSGLQYKILDPGEGSSPTPQDSVVVMYEGRLVDGTIFDSTYGDGIPAEFLLGAVIQGWIEGLQLMQEGSTFEFYIPAELAYGENPRPGGLIEPNHMLIFKVELLEVK